MKNEYCILVHIYGIQKDGTDEPTCRAAMEMQTENRLGDTGAGEGEDGTNGKSSMKTHTLPYVKQMPSENLLYDSGNSNWGSLKTQRAGKG